MSESREKVQMCQKYELKEFELRGADFLCHIWCCQYLMHFLLLLVFISESKYLFFISSPCHISRKIVFVSVIVTSNELHSSGSR